VKSEGLEATLPNIVTFPKNSLKGFYKMKRPMLVSGTAIGLSSAILILMGINALPFLLLCAVSVFILFFIKPLKSRDKIIIPAICISIILSCIFFGIYHFAKITPATRLDNTVTDISGKIITTPQETVYGTKFILKTDHIGNDNKTTKIQVYLSSEYDMELKLYDYISLPNTKLTIVRNEYNKPDADSISDGIILETQSSNINVLWESEKTPYYYCLRFKEIVTEQIKAYLPKYEAGFLLGMLFGDKTELDGDIVNDFRATGIAHLLAVSGLHTSTWCAYIIAFLKLFKRKEKFRNIICLLFLCGLCIVSGFTPSVVRASIMMAVVLFAPFFQEEQDPLNSLGFAVAILTLNNPYIITSVSFLLSVSATLGVLCSIYVIAKINPLINKVKPNPLRKITDWLSNNITTSVFAGLFTLPISAYFFGVFSLVSPITNILCVKPAFWSMLFGVLATAFSFIPQNIIQLIAIFLFDISTLFSDFVTDFANTLEKFKFCTLPTHKEYFLLGLITVTIIALTGFFIFKKKNNNKILKISAVVCVFAMSLSIILPCTELTPATLSVINVKNGVNISLRQGLKYAYINCGASSADIPYDYIPSAKCEKLDFLYIGKADETTNELTKALLTHSPQATVVTEHSKGTLNESNIILKQNTLISNSYTHKFNDEITLQTVDTYPVGCVIMKGYGKSVAICYGSSLDIEYIFENYGVPDVLVLSGNIPEALPENVDTLIISSDSDVILNKNIPTLKNQCKKYYTTAEKGDIKIIL